MTLIRPDKQPIGLEKDGRGGLRVPLAREDAPVWLQTPVISFYRMPKEGGVHDLHFHHHNQLYLITRGKAKIVNAGEERYIQAGDIVCIKAGDDHDILELYGDEDFEKFWLYEPVPIVDPPRYGHLHPDGEPRQAHVVPARPLPPDFPETATLQAVGPENKPPWLQTYFVAFWRCPKEDAVHDLHYHDYNQLYLVGRGKAKILNAGEQYYVRTGDIVCIKAGDDHDILETYGDEHFEKFFLYEPLPVTYPARFGHLHRSTHTGELHPVPNKPVPPDFPEDSALPRRICSPPPSEVE
jgi:mannose-6-phosphate isomerase-like protein (cupin superfamily)